MAASMREVIESRPIRDLTSPIRVHKGQRVLMLVEGICYHERDRTNEEGGAEHIATLEFDRTRLLAIVPETGWEDRLTVRPERTGSVGEPPPPPLGDAPSPNA